jgi:hypothetical protein
MRLMTISGLSWRDRIQLINSVLFCVVGVALIVRYLRDPAPWIVMVLGGAFLLLGVHRLALARRELRKRAGSRE